MAARSYRYCCYFAINLVLLTRLMIVPCRESRGTEGSGEGVVRCQGAPSGRDRSLERMILSSDIWERSVLSVGS